MTHRDIAILEWVARWRCVTAAQVRRRFEMGESRAYRRLKQLARTGLLRQERVLYGEAGVYLVTRDGLAASDSELPAPQVKLRSYRHDLAVVDLSIGYECERGRGGGPSPLVVSEREMRADEPGAPRYAIDLTGEAPGRHFPDLFLESPDRWAVELELGEKLRGDLAAIVGGYRNAEHLAGVIYYAEHPTVREHLTRVVAGADAESRVQIRSWEPVGSTYG